MVWRVHRGHLEGNPRVTARSAHVGVAALVLLLISSLAGVAQAQSEVPPGKVRGTWEVTLNVVDSVPVGEQTSEESPEGPGPSEGVHVPDNDGELWWRALFHMAVEPDNHCGTVS